MTFNAADRPALRPVETVEVVNLIGVEHGLFSFMRQGPEIHEQDVVCKQEAQLPDGGEVLR